MSTPLRAIIAEDSADDAELLARELRRAGYAVAYERVDGADALDAALAHGPWDIVFSDHSMPEFGSGVALQMVRGREPDLPFVIVSGTMGEDVAVDAMRAGATDYLVKGRLARLPAVVDRELHQAAARRARRSLERTVRALRDVSGDIGRLPEPLALAEIALSHVRRALGVDAAVLHTWDADAGLLRPVSVDGAAEMGGLAIRPGEGVAGRAFERRETVAIEDLASLPRRVVPAGGAVGAIAAPLLVGARVIGVLVGLSRSRRVFTADDEQLVQMLAAEIAPSFEAARLFAHAERQRVEAEALADAARAVAADGALGEVLVAVLRGVMRAIGTDGAAAVTVRGGRCEVAGAAGAFGAAAGRSFATASSVIARAVRTSSVQLRAHDEPPDESTVALGGEAVLAVPVGHAGVTLGALAVGTLGRGRPGATEVALLERFATLVALALENGRLRDAAEAHAAELERLAHYDALTGLANRARLRDVVAGAVGAGAHALLHLDIDHFKDTNDAFGARAGDALLRAAAARIRQVLGDEGVVARLGGDEFAALVAVEGEPDALARARDLHAAFDRPLPLEDEQVPLGVSIGVAVSPRDGDDAETLLRRAEAAVAHAKRTDGVAVYGAADDEYSPERLALMAQLRRAIERDELVLHYQPIVDVASAAIEGVEALVRWQHPERGLLPPSDVIPLAQRSGLMKRLTRWVMGEAVRQARRWSDDGLDVRVAVNIPMRVLQDAELPELVARLADRAGLARSRLALEITEDDVMADAAAAARILARLREMELRLAIDDFGTGYSSLAYLQRLAVNAVKIDRSFVVDMDAPSSRTIVRATIDLAHALGLQVVAEGVEDSGAWDELRRLGCDLAQGYHIARPMPGAEVVPWAARWLGSHHA